MMRRPGGVKITMEPYGRVHEVDTFTCAHCQRVIEVPPKLPPEEMGGFCTCCAKLVCSKCHASGICRPIEQRLIEAEAKYHARRSYEL